MNAVQQELEEIKRRVKEYKAPMIPVYYPDGTSNLRPAPQFVQLTKDIAWLIMQLESKMFDTSKE